MRLRSGGLVALLLLLAVPLALVALCAPARGRSADRAVLQIHQGGGLGGGSRMRVTLWASGRVAFATPDLVLRETRLDPAAVARLGRAAEVLFDLPERLSGLCGDDIATTFFAVDGRRGQRSVEVCGMGLEQALPGERDAAALARLRTLWELIAAELPPAPGAAPPFLPDEVVVETTPVDAETDDLRAHPATQEAVRARVARVAQEWPAALTGHLTGEPARQAAALAQDARTAAGAGAAAPNSGGGDLFRMGPQVHHVRVRPVLPYLSLPSATWPEGGLPRHPGAVAYSAPGTPYRFAGVTQAGVARWYRRAMAARGWRLVKERGDEVQLWVRADRRSYSFDPLILIAFQTTSFQLWPIRVDADVPVLPPAALEGCAARECRSPAEAPLAEAAAWHREHLGYLGWRAVGPDTYRKGQRQLRFTYETRDGRNVVRQEETQAPA